jgi:hypothetical protein
MDCGKGNKLQQIGQFQQMVDSLPIGRWRVFKKRSWEMSTFSPDPLLRLMQGLNAELGVEYW